MTATVLMALITTSVFPPYTGIRIATTLEQPGNSYRLWQDTKAG